VLRPPDIFVLLKVAAEQAAPVRNIASNLDLPPASVQKSLSRLEASGLIVGRGRSRRINRLAARDFLIHASKWIAPASPGPFVLGIPTAYSAEPMSSKLLGQGELVVIPVEDEQLAEAAVKGRRVVPLHENVPRAVLRDPRLYKLVALVDSLRMGRARERQVAAEELVACL
jgi:hypothetical protein